MKRKRSEMDATGLLSWADSNAFGSMLVAFRRRAGASQLHLALDAGVSTRHLGFLEIGRAEPSRAMVTRLASALRLGPFDCDQLHIAAGYVPSRTRKADDNLRRTAMALASMDAANAIYMSDDDSSLATIVSGFLKRFDIIHFGTATLHVSNGLLDLAPDLGVHLPTTWLERYAAQGFLQHDPLAWWNLRGSGIFHSDRAKRDVRGHPTTAMFGEAAEHGMPAGLTLPAPRLDGRVRSFCAWTDRIDAADIETINAVRVVASAWLDAIEFNRPGPMLAR